MRQLRGAASAVILTLSLVPAMLIAVALAPGSARADGDPASDILLGQDVFFPITSPVPHAVAVALGADVAALRREKLPLKVALIPTAVDLGTVTVLFGHPQAYAAFLAQEITYVGRAPLIVVMPAGVGVRGMPVAAARAVTALPRPASASPTALATTAIAAVRAYARAAGHPLPAGAPPAAVSGGSHSSTMVIALLLAAAALGAGAVAAATLRRRDGQSQR